MKQELQLKPIDTQVIVAFRLWLKSRGLSEPKTFSSDDLREFVDTNKGFQRYFSDSVHDYGNFMAKLKANVIAIQVGEKPSVIESNHNRKIDVFEWRHP